MASAAGKRGDVVVDRRQGERPRQIVGRHRSEADVVADRVGDQLRHLGQERRVRRHEEGGAVGEPLAVPPHLAGDVGLPGEAEQGAQHRALAGADRPGDDHERPAIDAEADVADTGAARIAGREAGNLQTLQRNPRRPPVGWSHRALAGLDRQGASR